MAERVISTRLVLEGEKQYRAAVDGINREYKLLQSQLKLVDSQFTGQRNTLAALEAKHKALNDVIANQAAKLKADTDALKNAKTLQADYARQAEEAKRKLEELAASTDDTTKETEEYAKQVAKLEAELNKNLAAEAKAAEVADRHATNANKAQASINQLNGELAKNDKYLDEAKNSADGCAKSIDAMGKETKEAADKAQELGNKGKGGIEAIAGALAAAGIAKTVKEIAEAFQACIDASIRFESSMAGVAKTTNLAGPELEAMGDAIKEMSLSIPLTADELAKIAEVAAQLGISKDYLLEFSQVMANLGVATNLTSEEAATMLAQFANITRMDPSMYSNLGSAIVALGNNFATNEKNIVEMSQRLAAAGELAGLTEPQILALATAMSSVGIQAEMGGTAMTQTLTAMEAAVANGGEALEQFAGVAGMTAGEFATAWQTAPMTAIQAFLTGLNNLQEQGGSATLVLEDMGLSGIRQGNMLKSLSLASDQVTKATNLANKAWKENNALTKEAETRYATTESKVKLFNNSVTALKIAVGDQLTPALGELAEIGGDVVDWAADFVEQNEWLGPAIAGVVTALGTLTAGVVAVTVVIPALKAAWVALQGAMGPIGWISLAVGAIAGLAAGIASATAKSKESIESLADTAKATPESVKTVEQDYQARLTEIETTWEKATTLTARLKELEGKAATTGLDASEWQEWNDILAMLVKTVPELSGAINLQTGEIEGGTAAIEAQITALDKLARQEAAKDALSGLYQAQAQAQMDLTAAQKTYDASYQGWQDKVTKRTALLQKLADAGALSSEQIKFLVESGATLEGASFPDTLHKTVDEFNALSDSTAGASKAAAEHGEIVRKSQEALDAANATLKEYQDNLYGAAEATSGLTPEQTNAVNRLNELKTELTGLTDVYTAVYDKALQSINGIVNGFNEIVLPEPTAINDLITALNSQNIYLDNYTKNLVKLEEIVAAKGLQDSDAYQSLVAMLSDGSVDSAAALQAIVDDGGANLEMLLTQVGEIAKGKETFATIVSTMQTDFQTKSAAIQAEMVTLAAKLNQSEAAGASVKATMDRVNGELAAGAATVEAIVARINRAIASIGNITYVGYEGEGFNTGQPGSHAGGLPYVPYDDYYARLHEGEMVLTRLQAKAYRAEQYAPYNYPDASATMQQPAVVSNAPTIDYDRLGASVAGALVGFGVNMDGERVGELVSGRVSRRIGEEVWNGRYA